MTRPNSVDPALPPLAALGTDLLTTSARQRRLALTRPLVLLAVYAAVAYWELWWLTPLVVFLLFVAVVTATHDVVHGSLGLGARATDWWLFVLGAVLLESGHAYRCTHLRHHQVFPGADDPEGAPARMRFGQAVLYGVVFLPRLWVWAYRRQRGNRPQQCWLLLEAGWCLGVMVAGALCWPWTKAVGAYAGLVLVGSWVYPLLTVYLPHHGYGDHPLHQTGTLRGWIIPALFLELTYHLEHHLYPGVPSHHLAELSKRLEPVFQKAGVRPTRVP